MKKLLLGAAIIGSLASFTGQKTEASNESSLTCADTIDEVELLELNRSQIPVGLYSTSQHGVSIGLQIYANSKDEFGMFRGAGNFANHTQVSFCKYNDRVFIKSENEYFEYYLQDNSLFLSEQEFDEKFPGAQSSYKFTELIPSKIIPSY